MRSKLHSLKSANQFSDETVRPDLSLDEWLHEVEEAGPKPPPKIKFSAHPIALNSEFTRARRSFEKILVEAPAGSLELQLFCSKGMCFSDYEIEERIASLKNPGNRSVRPLYKRYTIASLQEELRKRLSHSTADCIRQ